MSASITTLASLAWREGRSGRRRLLLYMTSIALGVAALVAMDSFSSNVTRSVEEQSRTLMGGDAQLSGRQAFTPSTDSLLDSLGKHGVLNARAVTFPSMILITRTSATRLAQVRGVGPGYPFYGTITTQPANLYDQIQTGQFALVDSAILTTTNARIGDTLRLGYGDFTIIGTLKDVPGTSGIAAALGPRVYIGEKYLAATELLTYGSTAEYTALLKLPSNIKAETLASSLQSRLEQQNLRLRTVSQSQRATESATNTLGTFIGIVGLVALLLGGIGVASGVRAFVARKIDTVAVLRCLGASSFQVLAIYVTQAAAMGIIGAMIGAVIGVAIQFGLPQIAASLLPVDVAVTLDLRAIIAGIAVGAWVALIFSLQPLFALRNISPLQTLRRESDSSVLTRRWNDIPRLAIYGALVLSVVGVAVVRAPTKIQGLWISLATGAVIAVLAASASLLTFAARRILRQRWPYVVRQGIANIYRPSNQTRSVVIALGFGTFLLTTLYLVQHSIVQHLSVEASQSGANVVFFDVQEDQEKAMDSLIRARGYSVLQNAPIVTMRIAEINGNATSQLAGDTTERNRAKWALRREYRSTYRDSLLGGETLLKGKWFAHSPQPQHTAHDTAEVSLERDIADELQVGINDIITWNVQGVLIPSRVTSIREVKWTRFEPNFFAVFSPGALNDAPKQFVMLTNIASKADIATIQHNVVQKFPNISSIDLSLITETVEGVLDKARSAIQALSLFGLMMGVPVLFSAIAATRRERLREGVLLKTLGASRNQILQILVTEYALLGILGSLTGIILAMGSAWALTIYVFKTSYAVAYLPALAIMAMMTLLTVTIGVLAGRDVFRETAITALRD